MTDVRWQQRLQNFNSAFGELEAGVQLSQIRALSKLEKQGLIKAFEVTHELACNVLKDFLEYQGNTGITGSRDASREAFRVGLVSDGDTWMEMIKSRNQTSHTYNLKIADDIVDKVLNRYMLQFRALQKKMESLKKS